MNHKLAAILTNGDQAACVAFFKGMSEAERRTYLPQVVAAKPAVEPWESRTTIETRKDGTRIVHIKQPSDEERNILYTWKAAYFAIATFAEVKKHELDEMKDQAIVLAILLDRKPEWLGALASYMIHQVNFHCWLLVNQFVVHGLIARPDSPKYALGLLNAFGMWHSTGDFKERLCQLPNVLEYDLWKLFEHEGAGEVSLANFDRLCRGGKWSDVMIELMNEGRLPRQRLLDCTLEALERDFNHYRAKWFLDFYDLIHPTELEIQLHSKRYLGLLRASAPNVSTWALAKVAALARQKAYSVEELCHALEPILKAKAKGTVLEGLKLLENLCDPAICETAANALSHEKADVQNATLALLEKHGGANHPRLRETVEKYAPLLAASVRKRCDKWLSKGAPVTEVENRPAKAAREPRPDLPAHLQCLFSLDELTKIQAQGNLGIPAAKFDGTDIPRLQVKTPIMPIMELEELIDECARIIEDGSNINDVERCIDGLSRLCGECPPNFEQLTGPILKRVRQQIRKSARPFCAQDPSHDVMGLVYAFCTSESFKVEIVQVGGNNESRFTLEGSQFAAFSRNLQKPIGFLSVRCQEIAQRIAQRRPCQLLSTPTHTGGWIEPGSLVNRVLAWSGENPATRDCILAMLRLAPETRAEALKMLRKSTEEWREAIRYALGADDVSIGRNAALWVAACRARSPWERDARVLEKFGCLGPDAGEPAVARYETERIEYNYSGATGHYFRHRFASQPPFPKSVEPMLVTTVMHVSRPADPMFEMAGYSGNTTGAIRWTATIWPVAMESFFAGVATNCFQNIDWSSADWHNRTTLEPLLDPGTPLRYAGLLFLVGMLAAKEPGESGLATDIAIRAIEDGRLGSDNLGVAMAELLPSGLIKPGRWQKTLAEVACASDVHGAVVLLALQQCLVGDAASTKDYGKLLELLLELCVALDLPISSAACRDFLGKTSSGKAGKLAKSLLSIGPSDPERIGRILACAVDQRASSAFVFYEHSTADAG